MCREAGKAADQQENPAAIHQGQDRAKNQVAPGEKIERGRMEEGELGPPGQEESSEEAALHYEERITRLLVTIVRLQGKMERLQQDRDREEEEDFFSDLGSESTASLPRCPSLFARRARSPSPPPPACPEEGKADLFLDVHKAVTSLENVLLWTPGGTSYPSHTLPGPSPCPAPSPGLLLPCREEEEDFFSDLGSESTASLPRCPSLFARRARSPSPPPPACPEEGKADLFLDVHKAVTSLENVLLSYRNRLPSVEAELQGCAQLAQGLEARLVALQRDGSGSTPQEAEGPPCERMTALYKERNTALRAELEAKQELLRRSKASMAAHQQERNKLQRKVQELQESLSRVETCSGGAPSPLGEGAQDSPSGAAQNSLQPPWGATSMQPAPTLPVTEIQSSLEQLHRRLEGLWGLNRLLSGALQESKTDAEQLSLLLGCQESHQTGLALALRGSERCLEAYETLLALTAAEQKPSPETGAEAPQAGASKDPNPALEKAFWILQACSIADRSSWDQDRSPQLTGSEVEAKRRLREHIGHLRAEQSSLKLPAHPPPPGLSTVAARLSAGIAAKATEGRRALQEAFPGSATPPRMEKGQLLRELHNAREALADLGTRLHLTAKAKEGLALWTHTLPAQEAACLLVIRTLQKEQRDLRGQPDPSSESSSSEEEDSGAWAPDSLPHGTLPAAVKDTEGSLARREPEALMLRVLETLARIQALKERLEGLWVDLEEKSQDYRAHEAQEMELMQDFFQAHSALLLAYQKARHKQESQVGQLETQVGLMTRRQAKQRQALLQTLRQLQDQVPAGAPTGLPRAPASEESTRDPPSDLETPSFLWSRK
ncbi:harmonin-binding protein USHBP1 [Ahaetulla prasina]|uniref:harmonin-binding protein USHBP1 n=1 Tax=Ahaetulla prasina TaxID=499056 RepID=UPI0026485173|nr:harmonin-binding protein USHBP1 [Ahaetulla prasina]